MIRKLMYAFIVSTASLVMSCQSTPSRDNNLRPKLRESRSSVAQTADSSNQWTSTTCSGTRNLITKETTYTLSLRGWLAFPHDPALVTRPDFQLERLIDKNGHELLDSSNVSYDGYLYTHGKSVDQRLYYIFTFYQHRAYYESLRKFSLTVESLDHRPDEIRRVVVNGFMFAVPKLRHKILDFEKVLAEPIILGDGLRMVTGMVKSESESGRLASITFWFSVTKKARENHSFPFILDVDLLNAQGAPITLKRAIRRRPEETLRRVLHYWRVHAQGGQGDPASLFQRYGRGFQRTYMIVLDEKTHVPARVRLTLAPEVVPREFMFIGENLPVP